MGTPGDNGSECTLAKSRSHISARKSRSRLKVSRSGTSVVSGAPSSHLLTEAKFLASLEIHPLVLHAKAARKENGPKQYKDSGPGTRFRDVVREIIHCYRIKMSMQSEEAPPDPNIKSMTSATNVDDAVFNVTMYQAGASGTAASLAKKARTLFAKPFWERTDEDIDLLYPVVSQLKYFTCFSVSAKREIARVLGFETYEDGRTIIKMGHKGNSMYFILSGAVSVIITFTDKETGVQRSMVVAKLPAGTSFGELALIQDCTRSATIKCLGTSQFLRINKNELDIAQMRSVEMQQEERKRILSKFRFFNCWDEQSILLAALNSKIISYDSGQIILGNHTWDPPEFCYFIVEGKCKILKKIYVTESCPNANSQKKYMKFCYDPNNLAPGECLRSRLLEIGTLQEGDLFSVGEDLNSVYFLAEGKVRCLVASGYLLDTFDRIALAAGPGPSKETNPWTSKNMKAVAEKHVMSEEEAFGKWLANLRWSSYRRHLVREVVRNKGRLETFVKPQQQIAKPQVMINNPTIGETPMSPLQFKSLAKLKKIYSPARYERLLIRLKEEIAASGEADSEVKIPTVAESQHLKQGFSNPGSLAPIKEVKFKAKFSEAITEETEYKDEYDESVEKEYPQN